MTILLMLETAGISYSKVVVDDDASEPGGWDFLHGWETLSGTICGTSDESDQTKDFKWSYVCSDQRAVSTRESETFYLELSFW